MARFEAVLFDLDGTLLDSEALILASYRPFSYTANLWRFDLLRYLKHHNPRLKIFILGNYFQTHEKNPCSMIVQRTGSLSACLRPEFIDYVGDLETVRQERFFGELKEDEYTFIDIRNLVCKELEDCPAQHNEMPMMTDHNHLTFQFTEMILRRIDKENPNYFRNIGIVR